MRVRKRKKEEERKRGREQEQERKRKNREVEIGEAYLPVNAPPAVWKKHVPAHRLIRVPTTPAEAIT